MTKEEKIQEAYGEYWEEIKEFINEDGWMFYDNNEDLKQSGINLMVDIRKNISDEDMFIRPKSLQGIENNNGWIKIESESDLPKESVTFWILDKELGVKSGEWKQAPNESEHKKACEFWIKKATHYQPIIKPELPIY